MSAICFTCDGSGWVDRETGDAVQHQPNDAWHDECHDCGGTGVIDPEDVDDAPIQRANDDRPHGQKEGGPNA